MKTAAVVFKIAIMKVKGRFAAGIVYQILGMRGL